jgi:hypothetical protein
MLDPRIRADSRAVTRYQYAQSLRQFADHFGRVKVLKVHVTLHINEPTKLYEGRDFAVGQTIWEDAHGEQHTATERWVREKQFWYTRSTGLVTPGLKLIQPDGAISSPHP